MTRGEIALRQARSPLAIRPRRGQVIRGIGIFNHRRDRLSGRLRFVGRQTSRELPILLGAGESSLVLPRDVGPDSDKLFGRCRKIELVLEPREAVLSTFESGDQLHVFAMEPAYAADLPNIQRRYAAAELALVQGSYRLHLDPVFPDHGHAQRRTYDALAERHGRQLARLHGADAAPLTPERQIPRSLHWTWLRDARHPFRLRPIYIRRMATWAAHNPHFALNLWTDAASLDEIVPAGRARRLFEGRLLARTRLRSPREAEAFVTGASGLENGAQICDLARGSASVACRSDLLRLMILWGEGGFYADLNDTECLAPFEPICARFELCIGLDRHNRVHNAVVGSAPRRPLIGRTLASVRGESRTFNQALSSARDIEEYFFSVLRLAGPYVLSQELCRLHDAGELDDATLLLPFPYLHNHHKRVPSPLAIARHYSSMSWVASERHRRGFRWWLPGMLQKLLKRRLGWHTP